MLRIAMLSYHTCPLATLGGKDTGGMNVYVRELTRQLGRMGIHVDVFTRSQDDHVPHVLHELGYGNRVVHVPAGPETPLGKREMSEYIPQFVDGVKAFACEKGIQYDLIHSHYDFMALSYTRLVKTPVLTTIHGFSSPRIMPVYEKYRHEYFVSISNSDRAPGLNYLATVYNGIDVALYPLQETGGDHLVFLGRIHPDKGIHLAMWSGMQAAETACRRANSWRRGSSLEVVSKEPICSLRAAAFGSMTRA